MSKIEDAIPGTIYVHNPRPVGLPVAFAIKGRKLVVDRMGQATEIPLAEIAEMRVSYEPRSFAQNQLRTRLRLASGLSITLSSVSFRSVVFADRQDAEYGAFVRTLAKAIAKANPDARFNAGRPYLLWLAMSGSAALLMGAIVLFIVYALSAGETIAAALGAFIAGLGIWQLEPLIRLNRPMPFSPENPPAALVPVPPTSQTAKPPER